MKKLRDWAYWNLGGLLEALFVVIVIIGMVAVTVMIVLIVVDYAVWHEASYFLTH